jgi:hypothetical protein
MALQGNTRTGEFTVQFVSNSQCLVSVMSFHEHLGHATKRISPDHSKSDWIQSAN